MLKLRNSTTLFVDFVARIQQAGPDKLVRAIRHRRRERREEGSPGQRFSKCSRLADGSLKKES